MNNRDVIYVKVSSSGGRQSIERQVADLTTYAAAAGALMRPLRKCVEKSRVNYLKSKDFLVVRRIININNLF